MKFVMVKAQIETQNNNWGAVFFCLDDIESSFSFETGDNQMLWLCAGKTLIVVRSYIKGVIYI